MQRNPAIDIARIAERMPGALAERTGAAPASIALTPGCQPIERRTGSRMGQRVMVVGHAQNEEDVGLVEEREIQPRPDAMHASATGEVGLNEFLPRQQEVQSFLDGFFNFPRSHVQGKQCQSPQ